MAHSRKRATSTLPKRSLALGPAQRHDGTEGDEGAVPALFGALVEAVPAGHQCTDTDRPSGTPRETTSKRMGGSSTWEPVSVAVSDYPDAAWTYEDWSRREFAPQRSQFGSRADRKCTMANQPIPESKHGLCQKAAVSYRLHKQGRVTTKVDRSKNHLTDYNGWAYTVRSSC